MSTLEASTLSGRINFGMVIGDNSGTNSGFCYSAFQKFVRVERNVGARFVLTTVCFCIFSYQLRHSHHATLHFLLLIATPCCTHEWDGISILCRMAKFLHQKYVENEEGKLVEVEP
jgi:hypothetical protein